MGMTVNPGVISGRVWIGNHPTGRIYFRGMIGNSAGTIALYDESGNSVTDVSCDVGSDGFFMLSFGWDPRDLQYMLNTDLRGIITVAGISTGTDSDGMPFTLRENVGFVNVQFAIALCLGNISFSPHEGSTPKYISILADFYIAIRKIAFPAMLNTMIKMTPEMLVVMGHPAG